MGKFFLNTGGDGMSGTGTDRPVEGAESEGGQLIITLGSAAVFGVVVDCLSARPGSYQDRCINVRRQRSFISGRSSRTCLDDQGRTRTQEDGKGLIFRSGSPSSDIASVPGCNSTG
jgi:hypothetical protein